MEKISWIKELVKAEQQMEESGIVDINAGVDPQRQMVQETIRFMLSLKADFVDSANVFNDMKPSALGRIKIYGIAKTHADFMLFRNGFKMIFTLKAAGVISIRLNFMGSNYLPSMTETQLNSSNLMEEQMIEAKWGPFGEIQWTFQGQAFKADYLVRHYMGIFIRESAK